MILLAFVLLAVAATMVGGFVPLGGLFSRETLARLFSARAGILLAVAFTELLPEAWALDQTIGGWTALGAFVALFAVGNYAMLDSCGEYLEQCRVHYLGWTALAALSVHSFLDGFNLSVAFSAGERAGAAVGLALALHKIADGFTLSSLFKQGGYSKGKSAAALVAVSSATPLAAFLNSRAFAGFSPAAEAGLVGFAAGSFIYIAAADLMPRLHRTDDRAAGLGYFALGMCGMAALKFL